MARIPTIDLEQTRGLRKLLFWDFNVVILGGYTTTYTCASPLP